MRRLLLVAFLVSQTTKKTNAFVEPQREVRLRNTLRRAKTEDDFLTRFTQPVIDDEGLVIADALMAGIVAPGLEAGIAVILGIPPPNWTLIFGRGKLVTPTLFRGFNLAAAWLGGALAARLYERGSYDFPGTPKRFQTTFIRCLQAGSFATALLIFSTQAGVVADYGFVSLGDDPDTDIALIKLADDIFRDVSTEALVLISWRLARTSLSYMDDDDDNGSFRREKSSRTRQ